jgi:hypothetical protein
MRAPSRASDSLSAIRGQVTELVRVWTWKDMEIYSRVIDGDTAAVRYKLTTVFNPSGELITTEIVDVVKVNERDGAIALVGHGGGEVVS